MTRVRWVIGNWKQNLLRGPAEALAKRMVAEIPNQLLEADHRLRIGIAPTFLALDAVSPWTRPSGPLWLCAQDIAAQDQGAFTGEIGPEMLAEAGVKCAIIGHSERRNHYREPDILVGAKLHHALKAGFTCVLCVGEPLDVRNQNRHESYVISQLSNAFHQLENELCSERLIIAYEPVWAIGTGKTATPSQASAMHRTIRAWLLERFGPAGGDRSILYGGSVKPANAATLMAAGDIDGFLVGGASLDASKFLDIVHAAANG